MSASNFERIFNPSSIAFVGASKSTEKAGGRRFKSIVDAGFSGPLYPVNSSAREVFGHRAVSSLSEIGQNVDLVFLAIAPESVLRAVEESVAVGAGGIVIISAGFGEVDAAGLELERTIVRIAAASGARVFGPNCAGIFSAPGRYNGLGWDVPVGPIGLVSQSGNIALDFADMARKSNIGFSRYATIGNAADVNSADLIDYYLADDATKVVLAYVEGFGEGEGRVVAERISRHGNKKPVIILKPGRSESGKRAALSHTGSLAGEDSLVDAAFRQAGIIRAYDVDEAWSTAVTLATAASPTSAGVVVLTDGGGHATLFCDTAGLTGLTIPRLSDETQRALRDLLPSRCSVINPVDFAGVAEGEPEIIPKVLKVCLSDPAIGSAALIGHFGGYHKLGGEKITPREVVAATQLLSVSAAAEKPLHVHSIHAETNLPAVALLRSAGIPVQRSIELCAKVLAHATKHAQRIRHNDVWDNVPRPTPNGIPRILAKAVNGSPRWLQEPESRQLLDTWGINVPAWRLVGSSAECVKMVSSFNAPVALKLISPSAIHKSDINGVQLNIRENDAVEAFDFLMNQATALSLEQPRVLITPMIQSGVEVVVGAYRDIQFGPVVMVGIGGVLVEVLKDVSFRLAPLSANEAYEMIEELKGRALLAGHRGRSAVAVPKVVDLLRQISDVMMSTPEIAEIDLNPVILTDVGASIADARIILSE
jgi:acyl-CoA synthetase (NDP forming)